MWKLISLITFILIPSGIFAADIGEVETPFQGLSLENNHISFRYNDIAKEVLEEVYNQRNAHLYQEIDAARSGQSYQNLQASIENLKNDELARIREMEAKVNSLKMDEVPVKTEKLKERLINYDENLLAKAKTRLETIQQMGDGTSYLDEVRNAMETEKRSGTFALAVGKDDVNIAANVRTSQLPHAVTDKETISAYITGKFRFDYTDFDIQDADAIVIDKVLSNHPDFEGKNVYVVKHETKSGTKHSKEYAAELERLENIRNTAKLKASKGYPEGTPARVRLEQKADADFEQALRSYDKERKRKSGAAYHVEPVLMVHHEKSKNPEVWDLGVSKSLCEKCEKEIGKHNKHGERIHYEQDPNKPGCKDDIVPSTKGRYSDGTQ